MASREDEELQFCEGMVFDTMSDLRKAVARHFAEIGCSHRKPVNTKDKLKVICTEHVGCPFLLHAYKREATGKVTVTTLVDNHSLVFVEVDETRRRTPSRVSQDVTLPIVQAYMTGTNGRATSADIMDHLRTAHQLTVYYHHAWRVHTTVVEAGVLNGKASYMLIENWLQKLQTANPGTAIVNGVLHAP